MFSAQGAFYHRTLPNHFYDSQAPLRRLTRQQNIGLLQDKAGPLASYPDGQAYHQKRRTHVTTPHRAVSELPRFTNRFRWNVAWSAPEAPADAEGEEQDEGESEEHDTAEGEGDTDELAEESDQAQ